MQYTDFQNLASSEKLTLATVEASKRLMGWTLHLGSVYSIAFPYAVISRLEDSGTAYTEVSSVGAVTASTYFLDRATGTLYLHATGSGNPNGRFLVATVKFFFSNAPITLPHDLNTGFEVPWEPLIQSTSFFGVEIDTVNQTSEAIEGNGTLTLTNDFDFWPANFDKLFFENQRCLIYSYNREINDPTQARLIFKGRVERKSYSDKAIRFQLKDQFSELRAPYPMGTIADLGQRTGDNVAQARQRLILGRVDGLVPTNIDEILDGYPLTGTVAISVGSNQLNGTGSIFLTELSPDDELVLGGVKYTVASVSTGGTAFLTENYADPLGLTGATAYVLPDQPKRYANRRFHVAGHALREPVTAVAAGSSVTRLFVEDATDIYAGDFVYIGTLGSGELVQVSEVLGTRVLKLATSLATIPAIGTVVRRPAVQNVRIDDVFLTYYRDYTFDATTAILELRDTAESSAAPIKQMTVNLSFTSGSRSVTGSNLKGTIKPGYMVGVVGNADFFEVLSVDSDSALTLRSAATFTSNTTGRYKSLIFDPDEHTLSLDALGKTEDGLTSGVLMKSAPQMVKGLLVAAGLASEIDTASFTDALLLVPQHLGIVSPDTNRGTTMLSFRDLINRANRSVFGSLVQNASFKFSYQILEPNKPSSTMKFNEADVLSFSLDSTSENTVKTTIIQYHPKEYDYLTGEESIQTSQKTSDTATHILKTSREKTISTYLVSSDDARIMAARWAFLLEYSTGRLKFTTKLQANSLEVGDVIEIEHRKFFERYGGSGKRRLMFVESVKRDGLSVQVEATDLSNAFNRVASFTNETAEFGSAPEDARLYSGYFTDEYGLIGNSAGSHGINLFW